MMKSSFLMSVPHLRSQRAVPQAVPGTMLPHQVKPSITGWAQVNGRRGETDTVDKMQKRVEHDLHTIRKRRSRWICRSWR